MKNWGETSNGHWTSDSGLKCDGRVLLLPRSAARMRFLGWEETEGCQGRGQHRLPRGEAVLTAGMLRLITIITLPATDHDPRPPSLSLSDPKPISSLALSTLTMPHDLLRASQWRQVKYYCVVRFYYIALINVVIQIFAHYSNFTQ